LQDNAVADVRRAIELQPNSSEAYFHQGYYLHERKAVSEARSSFVTARDLTPGILEARESIRFEALGPGLGPLLKKEAAVARGYLSKIPATAASSGRAREGTRLEATLKIYSVKIQPAVVQPGGPFDLRIEYSVTDHTRQGGTLTADLYLTIMEGPAILYTLPAVSVEVKNGQTAARVEHLNASPRKGTYTVQAAMRYKGATFTQSAELRVE
jgi:hypothetical protein